MKHTYIALGVGIALGWFMSTQLKTLPVFSTINDTLNPQNNL